MVTHRVKIAKQTRIILAGVILCALIVFGACGYLMKMYDQQAPVTSEGQTMQLVEEDFTATMDIRGELVASGDQLIGVLQVPVANVNDIFVGQQLLVRCYELQQDGFYGTITEIGEEPVTDSSADEVSIGAGQSYYEARVAFGALAEGAQEHMAISASISVADMGSVFGVPLTALGSGLQGNYVEAVYEDGTIRQCQVVQVAVDDDGRVIVRGANLTEGMTIRTNLS